VARPSGRLPPLQQKNQSVLRFGFRKIRRQTERAETLDHRAFGRDHSRPIKRDLTFVTNKMRPISFIKH
jgi:hypothetical protein